MKSFSACLLIGLARMRRKPGRLLGAILLPLAVLLIGLLLPPDSLNTPLEAGVCLPTDSAYAEPLWERLNASDPSYVIFYPATETEIYEQVAAGKWVCGFVADPEFDTRLTQTRPGRLAEVVQTPAETMAPLLREAFCAALYHVRAPYLASDYAAQNDLARGAELETVQETVRAGSPHAMQLDTVTVDGTAGQAPNLGAATARAACQGLIAVFLFLFALLLASELDSVREDGWFVRLSAVSGPFALRAGLAAAQMLPLTALAVLAYALSEIFFAGRLQNLTGFAALLGYALWLTGLALVLGRIRGVRHVLAALLPFLPAACLLLCPIFFDAARLFAPAAPISRLLPPSWLLRALQGATLDGVCLWGFGLAFLLAGAFPIRRHSP